MPSMKHEARIRDHVEDEPLADAVARARSMYAAGEGCEHRVVSEWLLTWGKPGRKPFKEWLDAWDG